MAKFVLTFEGVTGTYNDKGEKATEGAKIELVTGDDRKEATVVFEASRTMNIIIMDGKEAKDPIEKKDSGPASFALSLLNISFKKKMYSPNEIFARVQFSLGTKSKSNAQMTVTYKATIVKSTLESSFLNKKVSLTCDSEDVCTDYYVHEVLPEYKNGTMFVSFKIFSPDKQMTMMEYSRSFLSKKLWSEIVDTELSNFKLPYNTSSSISKSDDHSKFVKQGDQEHIFPYLVQYNESFYDFLKRTTNRWGEFLFYEDGNLNIGYDDSGDPQDVNDEDYLSLTYQDLTASLIQQANAGDFSPEAPDDEQIQKKVLTKGEYDVVKGELSSMFSSKDNMDRDVYVMKKLGNFFVNDKTIWGFLIDQGVEDGLSSATAETNSAGLNDDFDDTYFNNKTASDAEFNSEQYSGNDYNEFSEFNPILTPKIYSDIVRKEINSGRNAILIDYDTSYPKLKLGQIIKVQGEKYLVTQIEGYQPNLLKIWNDKYIVEEVDTEKILFKVLAIPQNKVKEKAEDQAATDTKFYPSLLPTGHVRHAGTQLAKVEDADDPARQNRVRVRFNWQSSDESMSPWLVYATPASTKSAGIHGKHYVDEVVMVNYVNGNVEHPYVIGAIEEQHPFPLRTNDIVYMTPAGQRILMSDGFGAGLTAFLASMNPAAKLVQGFFPGGDIFGFDASKSFEGSIELRDKYNIWSIKGSTDQRNVTIKSLWGDVKINAFTGITISAPNGDVKIKGKNVSIEAGSNLTLSSGSNIKNKFAWEGENTGSGTLMLANAAKEIAKKLATKVASLIDVSVIRHAVEIFVKPVEGKIDISAGRYLMLGAGGVKPDYPVDAYKKPDSDTGKQYRNQEINISFDVALSTINAIVDVYQARYNGCVFKKTTLDNKLSECVYNKQAQTKKTSEVIKAIWDNQNMDEAALTNAIGFKGVLTEVADGAHATEDQLKFFSPLINNLDSQEEKDAAVREAVNTFRTQVIRAAKAMQDFIKRFNDGLVNFNDMVKRQIDNSQRDGFNLTFLRNALVRNNLADCFIKDIYNQKYDAIRDFTADGSTFNTERKIIRRGFVIKLINELNFTRSAVSSAFNDPSGMTKATVPPVPSPDCDDAKWKEFVDSCQEMPKVEEEKDFLDKAITDPMLEASGIKGWKEFNDNSAFGSSKNGQIMFSSQDGTMVLERNIYRANVDHNDIPLDQQVGVMRSYIRRIRDLMSQA